MAPRKFGSIFPLIIIALLAVLLIAALMWPRGNDGATLSLYPFFSSVSTLSQQPTTSDNKIVVASPENTTTCHPTPPSDQPENNNPKTVSEYFSSVFPFNEANIVTKPYASSITQCHLTTNGVECTPILRNVRWKEPLDEVFIYDIDSPITRPMDLQKEPASPCMTSLSE